MHSLRRLLLLPGGSLKSSVRGAGVLSTGSGGDDEWNDAWESAWLPDDAKDRASWETTDPPPPPADLDSDTKAFVAEMDERWTERRQQQQQQTARKPVDEYRVRKQRIHAALWNKEIEKMEESRLTGGAAADDIDRLLDSCSEIFDAGNVDLGDSKIPGTTEFKTKPDGWEATSKTQDGNIWEVSQREEDILIQEFERRIAFSKSQIASFIKTHIFSRRRPIDGWKYMIEEIGPNARKGKGAVQRLRSLADPATQPFREEKIPVNPNQTPFRGGR